MGRNNLLQSLKETAIRRNALIDRIDIKELWEVLSTEQEWVDLSTMTAFCFPDAPSQDHESAVVRAFFKNRLYFKFNQDRFFPYTSEQVHQIRLKMEEETQRQEMIRKGGNWLSRLVQTPSNNGTALEREGNQSFINILKSYFLFEKESPHSDIAKAMLKKAGMKTPDEIFTILIRLGEWNINENIELLRLEIPDSFPEHVLTHAAELSGHHASPLIEDFMEKDRQDLTHLPTLTIDGQSTLDYDDALSIQDKGGPLSAGHSYCGCRLFC